MTEQTIDLMIEYGLLHVGRPYRWGGDDPIFGYDCSGFVQELLSAVGLDPRGDQTAAALHDHFLYCGKKLRRLEAGALVFYGQDRVTHVALGLDRRRILEAAGGGRRTLTPEDAARDNAYIRVRPLDYRDDLVDILMPDYSSLDGDL